MNQGILSNRELRAAASSLLKSKAYWGFLGIMFLMMAIIIIIELILPNPIVGIVRMLFNVVFMAFSVKLGLDFIKNGQIICNFGNACKVGFSRFLYLFGINLLVGFIVFLYVSLFIIAGLICLLIKISYLGVILSFVFFLVAYIIAFILTYRYRQVMFIACEDVQLPIREVLRRSKLLMQGHKGRLFRLDMTYFFAMLGLLVLVAVAVALSEIFGTIILLIVVFGMFYLAMHWGVANICFYQNLRDNSSLFGNDEEVYGNYSMPLYLSIIFVILLLISGSSRNFMPESWMNIPGVQPAAEEVNE